MIDYHDWCHFCGALSSLPEIDIDIDILIIIESVFEVKEKIQLNLKF